MIWKKYRNEKKKTPVLFDIDLVDIEYISDFW